MNLNYTLHVYYEIYLLVFLFSDIKQWSSLSGWITFLYQEMGKVQQIL